MAGGDSGALGGNSFKATFKPGRWIKTGPFGSQLKSDIIQEDGFKVYGQENVINKDFQLGNRFISEDKFKELAVCEIKPNHETARIDALIEKIRKSIDLLREYRTALITAAVTGKIDIKLEVN